MVHIDCCGWGAGQTSVLYAEQELNNPSTTKRSFFLAWRWRGRQKKHLVVERLKLLLAGGLDWPHEEAGRPLRRRRRGGGDPRAAQPHPGRARARAAEAAAPGRHRGGGRHRLRPSERQLFLSSSDLLDDHLAAALASWVGSGEGEGEGSAAQRGKGTD